ncbi:short-chain dehydrogenase/reductase [Lentinula aff. lateritia]|uniref:Short-chain dehydrogenase/reductase n=1 Tax=Lentinula aff. lateritia TaxID=2804960 RepID=A0ACC1TUG6_9AGAR|nr:short-chain dehydrogenase/reductase [Lentinula aff. lateritia]
MSLGSLTSTFHRDTYPAISPSNDYLSQAGKTVLITGGGGGIGFEIARSFAKAKAPRIIIMGRRSSVLDVAAAKLREEFKNSTTEFITHQGDISDDSSVASLWDSLRSRNIFVHVLVLNAAEFSPSGPDTFKMDKRELMKAFDVNVGGNFSMSVKFVSQPLRPVGQQLNLVNVSTAVIQTYRLPNQNPYSTSKAAFTALLGRIAGEHPVEDVQIISFHPGVLYSESASAYFDKNAIKWDEMALPADYAVWAASPEASWLHGRFVWAHWDVDELKADKSILKRLEEEKGFLKVAIQGLPEISLDEYFTNN